MASVIDWLPGVRLGSKQRLRPLAGGGLTPKHRHNHQKQELTESNQHQVNSALSMVCADSCGKHKHAMTAAVQLHAQRF